jgi:hypothetical protein
MASKRAGYGEVKAAIMQLLESAPSGKSARQVAVALGKDAGQMLTRLGELADHGKVIGVVPQVKSGRPTKIWFAARFADQAAAAGPIGWARKRTPVRSRTIADALRPTALGQDGSADGPKITRAAPFVDRRFVPDRVEPFFSAMRPGNYLRTGSAIERAYSGGAANAAGVVA